MIIIGYPGIGKTNLGGRKNFIDLDSTLFNNIDSWYNLYCDVAESLSNQGFNVLVSSHKIIRKILKNRDVKVISIVPSISLKDEWLQMLKNRSDASNLEKDQSSYLLAKSNYDCDIVSIKNDFKNNYVIKDMNFSLEKIIYSMV